MDNFRPINDVVLVKVTAMMKYSDIIEIPDSVAKSHPVSTGVVVKAGPGRWKKFRAAEQKMVFVPTDAKPGMHVCFFTAAMHSKDGKRFSVVLPGDLAIIRDVDVLFEFDADVKVDV